MSVLLDVDPWGGVQTMSYDHASGKLTIAQTTDIQAILDNNHELASGFTKKGDWWPIASVPLVVLHDWMKEYEASTGRQIGSPFSEDEDWNAFVYGRLDSNEFRKLRTGHFRIGK